MNCMIQIRNVPPQVHKQLKAKAALEGLSLSEYLLRAITLVAERPTNAQVLARLRAFGDALVPSAATMVREERDRR